MKRRRKTPAVEVVDFTAYQNAMAQLTEPWMRDIPSFYRRELIVDIAHKLGLGLPPQKVTAPEREEN